MTEYIDYYRILKIDTEAGPEEIKQAYRNLAKKLHPDVNSAPDAHERFIEITEAYEILMNRDLHRYYTYRSRAESRDFMKEQYEQVRREARENARRYAEMKYEKFRQEQEAFKKSGWHDLILTLRYVMRILVFPLIVLCIVLPLVSEQVSEHPTGYFIFWLIAGILIVFVLNNLKSYFRIDSYYYHLSDLGKAWKKTTEKTDVECYYCPGYKAMVYPFRISLFRIISIQMQTFGALYGRKAGSRRDMKTVRIPRSRKAMIIHGLTSVIKIASLLTCLICITHYPMTRLSLPLGLLSGGLLSGLVLLITRTKPKVSFLISYGMITKLLIWTITIWFMGGYAFILLFFDPMIEALLRMLSKDKMFIPLLKQYPPLQKLFHHQYQLYMELPVLSVLSPLFRWLF